MLRRFFKNEFKQPATLHSLALDTTESWYPVSLRRTLNGIDKTGSILRYDTLKSIFIPGAEQEMTDLLKLLRLTPLVHTLNTLLGSIELHELESLVAACPLIRDLTIKTTHGSQWRMDVADVLRVLRPLQLLELVVPFSVTLEKQKMLRCGESSISDTIPHSVTFPRVSFLGLAIIKETEAFWGEDESKWLCERLTSVAHTPQDCLLEAWLTDRYIDFGGPNEDVKPYYDRRKTQVIVSLSMGQARDLVAGVWQDKQLSKKKEMDKPGWQQL